jgi:heat shock protein HslJ
MIRITCGVIALAIIAVLIAGCTSQAPAAPVPTVVTIATTMVPATAPVVLPPDLAGDWTLTTMGIQGGTAIQLPTAEITLSFGGAGTLAGNGGCNNYFGNYTLTGQTTTKGAGISIGPLGSTKMYCQTTSDQETRYLGILQNSGAYVVDGTQLTLTDKDQNVLIYQRPSTIPVQTPGMLPN